MTFIPLLRESIVVKDFCVGNVVLFPMVIFMPQLLNLVILYSEDGIAVFSSVIYGLLSPELFWWPQNFLHQDLLHLFWLFGTLPSWPNKSACSNRPTMHCPCFYKISVEFLGKSPQFKDQPAADSCPTEWLPWWWDSHHRSPASAGTGFLKVAIRLVVPA